MRRMRIIKEIKAPTNIELKAGESLTVNTGVKIKLEKGYRAIAHTTIASSRPFSHFFVAEQDIPVFETQKIAKSVLAIKKLQYDPCIVKIKDEILTIQGNEVFNMHTKYISFVKSNEEFEIILEINSDANITKQKDDVIGGFFIEKIPPMKNRVFKLNSTTNIKEFLDFLNVQNPNSEIRFKCDKKLYSLSKIAFIVESILYKIKIDNEGFEGEKTEEDIYEAIEDQKEYILSNREDWNERKIKIEEERCQKLSKAFDDAERIVVLTLCE